MEDAYQEKERQELGQKRLEQFNSLNYPLASLAVRKNLFK